jgi:Phytanoyl-CoA dioxygenase (PhyH)
MGTHRVFADGTGAQAVRQFRRTGWVHVRPADGEARARLLQAWADEVAAWPDGGGWLHHRELTDTGPALCRTENMVPHHDGLRSMLCSGALVDVAGALLGEPAVLYKDKLNYKLPGGAGYSAHQDAPAYRFVDVHVSCMVAIDDADESNGCLEVVSGAHDRLWRTDDAGCIRADVAASMVWQPSPCVPAMRCGSTRARRTAAVQTRRGGRGGPCTRRTTRARRATSARTTTARGRPSLPPPLRREIGWRSR